LLAARERYPNTATYGISFWRGQLEHLQPTGQPDIFKLPTKTLQNLNLPWLKYDQILTWKTAPGGPRSMTALFVGPASVMFRLAGGSLKDYDPKQLPGGNVWLKVTDLEAGDAQPLPNSKGELS
jgi:hypothetical protein